MVPNVCRPITHPVLNPAEIPYVYRLVEESMTMANPPFDYFRLDVDRSHKKVQDGRREITRPVYFEEPYKLPAFVEVNPSERTLSQFGVKVSRELIFITSMRVLEEFGFDLQYGDVIVVFGDEYNVWEVQNPTNGWFGFHRQLLRSATCMRKTKSSTLDNGPLDDRATTDTPEPNPKPVKDDWNV